MVEHRMRLLGSISPTISASIFNTQPPGDGATGLNGAVTAEKNGLVPTSFVAVTAQR